MGHVRRVESGRWEARYRAPDGRERSRRFGTKREAQWFLSRTEADRQRGEWLDPAGGRMPLRDWAEEFTRSDVSLRPSSRARDESYLRNHVLTAFGDVPLGQLTHMEIRRWVTELHGRGLAPATVHKVFQTLSKLLRGAVDAGMIRRSPADRISLPRIERREMRVIAPAEIARLAEAITPRYRALVLLDAYAGLRLGELAGLRRSQLDLERRVVRVSQIAVEVRGGIFHGPPKTNAGRRDVPLPRLVVDALRDHLDTYAAPAPDGLVFPGSDGGILRASQWRQRHWNPAIKAAGVDPLRPHDLRHTAVSLWIAAGASPKQIATWAGHTSVAVVLDRYGHLFPGHEREVIDRLDELGRGQGLGL
ncbi:MAG: tyrosine-type recombinase/integrase [Acidobacteria bacterium]|nr:tyrosine-type recombinase/integrase [Acidobacteriota bacterium]